MHLFEYQLQTTLPQHFNYVAIDSARVADGDINSPKGQ